MLAMLSCIAGSSEVRDWSKRNGGMAVLVCKGELKGIGCSNMGLFHVRECLTT